MLSKSLKLLTHPLWHTPADKASASAWGGVAEHQVEATMPNF